MGAQTKAQVDKLLTNVSNAYIPKGHISESLFPMLNSKQATGKIGNYTKDHLRIVNTTMGGRGKTPEIVSMVRGSTNYKIEKHGLSDVVTEDDLENVEKPFDAEKDVMIGLNTVLWLGKEKALADALSDTSVLTNNITLSGTAQFSDYANSDPLGQFKTARLAVRDLCGEVPDVGWMDWGTANTLAYHPGILEALGFTANRAGQLSNQELAKAMGLNLLFIARPMFNNTKEGQTSALASVWGKHIGFAVLPRVAQKYQQSMGYYIKRSGQKSRQVFKFDLNDPPNSKKIIVRDDYDYVITDADCAYLIENAIA